MSRKINCSILTPERQIYNGEAELVVLESSDGEMGFLVNHAPIISELGIGELRIKNQSQLDYYVVEGGFVELKENAMIILAENVIPKAELQIASIKKEMDDKLEQKENMSFDERVRLRIELKKLKARLQVASH